jgi:hypothetical protein
MQTPKNIDEAKAMLAAEEARLSTSFNQIIGSRWLMAILATCCLAFGLHALYAPTWLPSFSGLSLTTFGLPDGVDLGFVGQQAQEAAAAAQRQDVAGHVKQLVDPYPWLIPAINTGAFAVCLALLLVNMTIMTKRRRFTRG